MIGLRLKKALGDIAFNKSRTFLAVLSIAIGVAGVGAIGQSLSIVGRGMDDSVSRIQPADAAFAISAFDASLLEKVKRVPGVKDAEGRFVVSAKIESPIEPTSGERKPTWNEMELAAVPDYRNGRIDRIFPWEGEWPPVKGGLYLEHLTADYLGVRAGDDLRIETPDGKTHAMRIAGILQYPGKESTTLSGLSYGFVTQDTLPELGLPAVFNTLSIRMDDASNRRKAEAVADRVRTFIGEQGQTVLSVSIPEPGKHWGSAIVDSMGSILQSLGLLALLLSATLVTNTVFALMAGQIRQIGIMKVLGAKPFNLIAIYVLTILLYGLMGLVFGIPLGIAGESAAMGNSINLLNFDGTGYGLSPGVVWLQIFIGVVVPMAAAAVPIWKGIRITEREAIGGQSGESFGSGRIDRLVERVRGLPRPFLLSLRNTFRKKGRLVLTLCTLGLGGAIVVSVFSVYASLNRSLESSLKYMKSDVSFTLGAPAPEDSLRKRIMDVPGVASAETWSLASVQRVRGDGSVSGDLAVAAPPMDTKLIQPDLAAGRWLRPDDRNAIVLDKFLLAQEPDLRVGDSIVLRIQGKTSSWHVVGIAKKLVGDVISYVKEDDLNRLMGAEGTASQVHLITERHDRLSQTKVAADAKASLKEAGMPVSFTLIASEFKEVQTSRIQIVIVFILVMAVLMVLVSGLGLMGTMSLNVLERTREIGILRSIGAGDRSVWGIVIGETLVIGAIGWLIGTLLALPASYVMSLAVGQSLYKSPLNFVFPWSGPLYWLLISLTLAVISGFIPAWKASRLTVRDAVNYE